MSNKKTFDLICARNNLESSKSLYSYLNHVVIDSRPEPRLFGDLIEPWQRERNDRLVPALEFVAGLRKDYNGVLQFWEGFGKGHDKSSYLGRILNWLLAFAPRKGLRLYCAAKDAKQAAVIRDCMYKESELNSGWLKKKLEFKQHFVLGRENGSQLEILASDAAGSHGTNPDLVVCDEITHWDKDDMFQALSAGVRKRSGHAALIVLTNAGYINSWQDNLRSLARDRHGLSWSFFEQPYGKPMASWITPEQMEEARLTNSDQEYRRLFLNEWINLSEDRGVFREADVDAAIADVTDPPPNAVVVLGVDYGLVNDRTALSVVWFDGERVQVSRCDCWQGTPTAPIKVDKVEKWIDSQLHRYPKAIVVFDKFQMEGTIQKLEDRGVDVKKFDYRGGKQLYALAENLRSLLQSHKLQFAEDCGYLNGETLASELKEVIYKPMSYGYRIDHESTKHDDRVVSVGMAALEAVKHPPTGPMILTPKKPDGRGLAYRGNTGIFSSDHLSRRGLYGC